jgi:hypothetical protein
MVLPNSNLRDRFGRMATTSESLAFDRGVRPVMEIVLPEKADAVIGFRADPELRARIEELARKSTEGELTEDERAEYAGYVRANKFVAILKRQAQHLANSQS